jgi:hypothetical protein
VNCRLTVFATRAVLIRRRMRKRAGAAGRAEAASQSVAWQGWNADPRQERAHGRLNGSGSFYWPDPRKAYRAAVTMMRADETISAVRIEGIGSQPIGYLRRADIAPSFGCHPGQPELLARF